MTTQLVLERFLTVRSKCGHCSKTVLEWFAISYDLTVQVTW
jgi:hypothetical protein